MTFSDPSSQPPFGTESMWPPISTARSEAPRSVNHWLPAASTVSSTGTPSSRERSQPRARSHVSVHATRCAPFSSPVSSASSRSSATVREGSSGTRRRYRLAPAMSVLIKNGRIVTAADDYVADVYVEDETVTLIGESLDHAADKVIDATGKYVLPGMRRPAHAPGHALRRHGHDRRLRVRPGVRRVRRHHLPRRLRDPAAGLDLRRDARALAREARGQGADRQRLPHRRHRPARGRHARGARRPARPGRHLVQAVHGLQGRAHGRRRDALPDDGGRGRERRARDGARGERRRDRRARQAARSSRATPSRSTTR